VSELPVRRLSLEGPKEQRRASLLEREWLVANGLGGYASGTFAGVPTRRFHAWLVAALPSPIGRATMLNRLSEVLVLPTGERARFSAEDAVGGALAEGAEQYLESARLEGGLPVWRYAVSGYVLEKRVVVVHRQNTVHVTYALVAGARPAALVVRPFLCFRRHDAAVMGPGGPYVVTRAGDHYEVHGAPEFPRLRLALAGASLALDAVESRETYLVEQSRGYDFNGALTSPGYFEVVLGPGDSATLIASTEPWDVVAALGPEAALEAEHARRLRLLEAAVPAAREGIGPELVLAADQFIVLPGTRADDATRARATGDEVRTVIAGYHWFTDWGRDSMISLEGLTLLTGRHAEAGCILRTFARYVADGLIPNLFPEGTNEGLYHTADASLWYFHALSRYVAVTSDSATLKELLPVLRRIADAHLAGTRFGIAVDPEDGLLRQGQAGYQLTWMDAKVGDWVVTPRRGKAVEINALYYNALVLLASWLREHVSAADATPYEVHAERVRASFNARFWNAQAGYLYDVVDGEDGDDESCRPNQLIAFSLTHPVLDRERWEPVLAVCEERLVTPFGLRSLSREHPDYKSRYFGDLRARDAAYHQGTVWAWLVGPFVDAFRRARPGHVAGLRRILDGLTVHLDDAGVGQVSEIFDAEPPFAPRGCIAQAWSIAELLRALVLVRAAGT
jgi:predicted glycogen debranching enzyme